MKGENIYIGNCSKRGIYQYRLEKDKLIKNCDQNDFERCTYLSNGKRYLYGVIEKENGYIVSYKKEKGKLNFINQKPSLGKGPCHVEVDSKNNLIYISNYQDGKLTIFNKESNGKIGEKIYSKVENKEKSHVHCVKMFMNKHFFLMTDLGTNLIIANEIKNKKIREISRVQFREGTEPRHIAVGKNKIYVVTEKSCELYVLELKNKKLSIVDKKSIIPSEIIKKDNYTGCAIKISKDFKFLYVTIRGHNSISTFETKNLKMIQNVSCEGDTPRDLELNGTEKYILVANQESNEIAIFERNKKTGKIKFVNKEGVEKPTCIVTNKE